MLSGKKYFEEKAEARDARKKGKAMSKIDQVISLILDFRQVCLAEKNQQLISQYFNENEETKNLTNRLEEKNNAS